uniref:Secreted protein n=1 Tax=Ascaris lumbricoides TaxID=6252 RepID=A0A0M3HWZ2_ASCLU
MNAAHSRSNGTFQLMKSFHDCRFFFIICCDINCSLTSTSAISEIFYSYDQKDKSLFSHVSHHQMTVNGNIPHNTDAYMESRCYCVNAVDMKYSEPI